MSGGDRPWTRKRPAASKPAKLTAEWRQKARARARNAGRRYPNLVDNMWASAQQKNARRKRR